MYRVIGVVRPHMLDAIRCAAHAGRGGDGKVFVVPVGQVVRIRTAGFDGDAL